MGRKRVASKSGRQRRLERQRAERRMARLAEQQRRRRRSQAIIGGSLALILVVLGTTWLLGGFSKKPAPVSLPTCTWTPRTAGAGVEDTGLPDANPPKIGAPKLILTTDLGEIDAIVDVASAPCAAASLRFLVSSGFYSNTTCVQLDSAAMALTCGSKTGDASSSPGYQFPVEGVPHPMITPSDNPTPSTQTFYNKASLVMTNVDTNAVGSQFFIVYGDASNLPDEYTRVGSVLGGLDIVQQVANAGATDGNGNAAPTGKPKTTLTIKSATITDDLSKNPSASPSASASQSAT